MELIDPLVRYGQAMAVATGEEPARAQRSADAAVASFERACTLASRHLSQEKVFAQIALDAASALGRNAHALDAGRDFAEREQVAPLYWEQPEWSSLQRRPSRRTVVVVEFGIDADAFVSSPTIVESADKALDDLILATIERWRYAPPLVDGAPVGSACVTHSTTAAVDGGDRNWARRFAASIRFADRRTARRSATSCGEICSRADSGAETLQASSVRPAPRTRTCVPSRRVILSPLAAAYRKREQRGPAGGRLAQCATITDSTT